MNDKETKKLTNQLMNETNTQEQAQKKTFF